MEGVTRDARGFYSLCGQESGGVPVRLEACYKPAAEVVGCVVDAGLAEVEYELLPLTSLKGKD